MPRFRCPGMDPGRFTHEDIKIRRCRACGEEIEFWKDDVRLSCPACGHVNFNPDINHTCLAWCKSAARCLGNRDILEWLEAHPQRDKGGEKR